MTAETTISVLDLTLGDVITRDIAKTPVRWTLTCDPTTRASGDVRAAMQQLPDQTIIPLTFRRSDTVTVQAPAVRATRYPHTLIGAHA